MCERFRLSVKFVEWKCRRRRREMEPRQTVKKYVDDETRLKIDFDDNRCGEYVTADMVIQEVCGRVSDNVLARLNRHVHGLSVIDGDARARSHRHSTRPSQHLAMDRLRHRANEKNRNNFLLPCEYSPFDDWYWCVCTASARNRPVNERLKISLANSHTGIVHRAMMCLPVQANGMTNLANGYTHCCAQNTDRMNHHSVTPRTIRWDWPEGSRGAHLFSFCFIFILRIWFPSKNAACNEKASWKFYAIFRRNKREKKKRYNYHPKAIWFKFIRATFMCNSTEWWFVHVISFVHFSFLPPFLSISKYFIRVFSEHQRRGSCLCVYDQLVPFRESNLNAAKAHSHTAENARIRVIEKNGQFLWHKLMTESITEDRWSERERETDLSCASHYYT